MQLHKSKKVLVYLFHHQQAIKTCIVTEKWVSQRQTTSKANAHHAGHL